MEPQSPYEQRAVVLGDGYVDRINGPRCVLKMSEGPSRGLYLIARTEGVLRDGQEVFRNEITGWARIAKETGNE